MNYKFFILLMLWASAMNSLSAQPGTITAGGSHIKKNPASLPEELQEWLHFPGAKIHTAGYVTGSSFMTPGEGVAVLRSDSSPEEIVKYYTNEFQKNRWTILQSGRTQGKALLMAESIYKRLVTVIVTEDKPSIIKIYYKRSGNE